MAKKAPTPASDALSRESHAEMIRRERRSNDALHKLCRNKTAVAGFLVICIMVIFAVFAPWIATHDPYALSMANSKLPPGVDGHIFGTDELGRDLFSRIVYGSRVSISVALGGTILGGILGSILGMIAGYNGKWVDSVIMRIMDGMFAFPFILLSIFLMTIFGDGLFNVILAIGIADIPKFARTVRGQVVMLKNEEYCAVEQVLGASGFRILVHHIMPNAISPIIVYGTLNIASAILAESALGFLGLGVITPTPSWGNILRAGKDVMNTAPHIASISGGFIMITVLAFNLFGDGVRDVLDPKMKK
ncbi:ABC transporter permease [Oscillospiraceae bacterium 50-16]